MDFNTHIKPTWCPGCGNFAIWLSLKNALSELNLDPKNILIFYGIGCSGNGADFIKTYGWHSLHGRSVPSAIGAKLANKNLKVIVVAGDGDSYGEGIGHFIHAIRGNTDITYIVHDNQVYGLTTGQVAPTAEHGYKSKSTPEGIVEERLNPLALAIANQASFVSRGFSGDAGHLKELFKSAISHPGFSLVDVFQPCVTFNLTNTFKWFFDRLYNLDKDSKYNKQDLSLAWQKSQEWGVKIPYGIFYQSQRLDDSKYLAKRQVVKRDLDILLKEFS